MSPEALIAVLVVIIFLLVFYIESTGKSRPKKNEDWKDWK